MPDAANSGPNRTYDWMELYHAGTAGAARVSREQYRVAIAGAWIVEYGGQITGDGSLASEGAFRPGVTPLAGRSCGC